MMNFRVIAAAITTLLGNSADGNFVVVGYRNQRTSSEEIRNNKRRVQCYFSNGDFPKSSGRQTGATQHQMTFNLDLSVAASAKADLSVLNDPDSTALQISTSLAAMQDASHVADGLMDEFIEYIYQFLMDGNNFDLGLGKGIMSSRWVDFIRKDDPAPQGDLVTLTARLQYTCQTVEEVTGEVGTLIGSGGIFTQIDIEDDDVERTGVEV